MKKRSKKDKRLINFSIALVAMLLLFLGAITVALLVPTKEPGCDVAEPTPLVINTNPQEVRVITVRDESGTVEPVLFSGTCIKIKETDLETVYEVLE